MLLVFSILGQGTTSRNWISHTLGVLWKTVWRAVKTLFSLSYNNVHRAYEKCYYTRSDLPCVLFTFNLPWTINISVVVDRPEWVRSKLVNVPCCPIIATLQWMWFLREIQVKPCSRCQNNLSNIPNGVVNLIFCITGYCDTILYKCMWQIINQIWGNAPQTYYNK